ncbi:hypothetical protein V8C86DRAFT_757421 [Haematococcus lacustris]
MGWCKHSHTSNVVWAHILLPLCALLLLWHFCCYAPLCSHCTAIVHQAHLTLRCQPTYASTQYFTPSASIYAIITKRHLTCFCAMYDLCVIVSQLHPVWSRGSRVQGRGCTGVHQGWTM